MGRRQRRREKLPRPAPSGPQAPQGEYQDAEGNVLVLRGALSAGTRREYARTLAGGLELEDAQRRATEMLFERLAVVWTIAGLEVTGQKGLLGRYRLASDEERQFVRRALRSHAAEHFPELEVP